MDEYYSGEFEESKMRTYNPYEQEGLIEGKNTINPIFFLHVASNVTDKDIPTLKVSLSYLDLNGKKITTEILDCSYEAFVDRDKRGKIEDIGYYD